jgi:hypothetical protein
MPNPQKGEGVAWPLMGRIFIFDDGARKAAIITLDLLFLDSRTVADYRQAVTAGAGLAPTDVMIACSHTHWAPHTLAIMNEDAAFDYLDFVRARLVEGFAQALRNLQPARLSVGRADAPGWAFNRRPIYRTAHGEQVGTQGPQWIPEFLRMEGPADPDLQALLVEDLTGRALGGLVNFTCHTTTGPDEPLYSSDYPGPLTEKLAGHYGGIFGFLQGCAGNIWQMNMSRQREPVYQENGTAHTRKMGEALADRAIVALAQGRLVTGETIRLARQVLHIPQRRPTHRQIELARWFLEKRPADADLQAYMFDSCGHDFTFFTDWAHVNQPNVQGGLLWQEDWFARGLLGLWEWQRRVGGRELVEDLEVQTLAVGDVAFCGYPAEYFVEYGLQTKALSPFANTFVSELTNGWHGYVPTQKAFAHGGYETRLGDASRMIPETGDRLCEAGMALLHQIHS